MKRTAMILALALSSGGLFALVGCEQEDEGFYEEEGYEQEGFDLEEPRGEEEGIFEEREQTLE